MTRRIIGLVLVLFSILVLPYWIYILVLFLAIILFPFFWEGIFLAFLIDLLYGGGISTALGAFVLLITLLPIRENLRFR